MVTLSVLSNPSEHTHAIQHESGDSWVTLLCIGCDAQLRGAINSLAGAAIDATMLKACFSIHLGSDDVCRGHAGQKVFSFQRSKWIRDMLECVNKWAFTGGHHSLQRWLRAARVHITAGDTWNTNRLPFFHEFSHSSVRALSNELSFSTWHSIIRGPNVLVFTLLVGARQDTLCYLPGYSSTRWRTALERELSPARDSEHAEILVQELANDETSPERGRDTPIEEAEEKAFPEWLTNSFSECIVASAETRTNSQDFDFSPPAYHGAIAPW